jgi:hypothetical protein
MIGVFFAINLPALRYNLLLFLNKKSKRIFTAIGAKELK